MFTPLTLRKAAPSRLISSHTSSVRPSRLAGLVVHSNKGFGTKGTKKRAEEDIPVDGANGRETKRVGKNKGKQQMRMGQAAAQAAQQRLPSLASPQSDVPTESLTAQIEFEERLKALKIESDRKKAEVAAQNASGSIFAAQQPSYDNPPPLSSTLFGSGETKNAAAEKEYAGATFGPGQVGIAVASLALVGVFLVSNGGSELGYASRRPSQQAQQVELAPEQRADLEKQLADVNTKLEGDANDLEALEAAAILHARLGEYTTAAEQLEKLSAAKPEDVDVLRVLAEAEAAAGDPVKSTQAYKKAWTLSNNNNLEVLTGLASALVAEGNPKEAVDIVRGAAASPQAESMGEVELGLLVAKTYGQWRGHAPDAASQYDLLIEKFPDDFRPLLGKALLLRDQGQEGDAQRYIIQAKYKAPPASRPIVDALTAPKK